jgi:uncharacterized membrane protein
MVYALLKTVHLMSVIVWLGGMFFTLFCLRHAVHPLLPEQRMMVMVQALGRFFKAVAVASLLAMASGAAMVSLTSRATRRTGAPFNMPLEWLVMGALGALMLLVFAWVCAMPFRRLRRAEKAMDWRAGSTALKAIRVWVSLNLAIGAVIVVVVMAGTMS